MLKYIISIIVLVLFTACSSIVYEIDDIINTPNGTDFSKLSNKLAVEICPSLTSFDEQQSIYITDFVNVSTLQNQSQLGFVLSNNLKSSILQTCGASINIKELTLGKNIKIGQNGTRILSRNIKNLKLDTISTNGKVVVGTYAITSQKLLIYTKVIDLVTNKLYYSKTTSTNMTKEILELEKINEKEHTTNSIYRPLVL